MNIKKYLIYTAAAVAIIGGAASLVLAQDQNIPASGSHPKSQVVKIGPEGRTLLRGTIKTVGVNSLSVTSWGGDWTINVTSDTKIIPGGDLTKFKAGDFVGVQGTANQSAAWTIDAKLVRDWSLKQEVKELKKEIKEVIKETKAKNWQGTVSNVNTSNNSLTLTVEGTAYTVNLAANAKIVNEKFVTIKFSDIKNGDTVKVFGPSSDTTITASVVRDISIGK